MPTYVYETIPQSQGEETTRFEIRQSINDPALTRHPDSGVPVKRIVAGGAGILTGGSGKSSPMGPTMGGACERGGGCACRGEG
ncbi:MAG: zinc ribbon domain-containing protein [Verrucomicrobiae bacterium]|nr:zinc ribbon domain-containing protein [Verrucomicrobiae bacterium]MCP5539491.1 zinc ribbon domain-containing protein [Akkermansiaceae bacterium]